MIPVRFGQTNTAQPAITQELNGDTGDISPNCNAALAASNSAVAGTIGHPIRLENRPLHNNLLSEDGLRARAMMSVNRALKPERRVVQAAGQTTPLSDNPEKAASF
jgi:hypothetical protein